ncbi:MAG TPA: hypothetical protein VGK74_13195 [Symbiobacteriaceae bacterium]|jgi:integrase
MSKETYWKLKGAFQRLSQTFPSGQLWVQDVAAGGLGLSSGVDPTTKLAYRQRRGALIWSALTGTPLPEGFVSTVKISDDEVFALNTGLLSEMELMALEQASPGARPAAVAVVKRCLVLGKPFREWSDAEFVSWRQPKGHTVATARIQKVRRDLGYSTLPARRVGSLTRAQFEPHSLGLVKRQRKGPVMSSFSLSQYETVLKEASPGSWLPWPLIEGVLGLRDRSRIASYHAKYEVLRAIYPTGKDWLVAHTETPLFSPEALRNRFVREHEQKALRCGIAWATVTRTPVPPSLLDHGSLKLVGIAKRSGLVTDKELKAAGLDETKREVVRGALSIGVPFSEWTDALAEQLYAERYCSGSRVPAKTIQNVRVRMRYTTKPRKAAFLDRFSRMEQRSASWAALLRDYNAYLATAGLAESSRLTLMVPIGRFVRWLLDSGRESAHNLSSVDLSAWFATLPPALTPRTRLRQFMRVMDLLDWGCRLGSTLLPPTKPKVPVDVEEFALGVTRPADVKSRGTPLQDLKAFLKAVYNMPVEREEERLARDLILLIACTGQRIGYYLNLEWDCMVEPPSAPGLVALASRESLTKQKDLNATYAVLDRRLGVATLKRLQERICTGDFGPLTNPDNGRTYVHLFSLSGPSWVLNRDRVYEYVRQVKAWAREHPGIDLEALDATTLESTCHSLRHLVAGLVLAYTKDPYAVQVALDHGNLAMTDTYLQGPAARDLVITHMARAYKENRLTGGFFVQVIAALEDHANSTDCFSPMLQDLFVAADLDEYEKKWSRKTPLGRCLYDRDCEHYYACMACQWQLFRQEDAENGLILLRQLWGDLIAYLTRSSSKRQLPQGQDLNLNAMTQQTLLLIKATIQRLLDVDMEISEVLEKTLPAGVDVDDLVAEFRAGQSGQEGVD